MDSQHVKNGIISLHKFNQQLQVDVYGSSTQLSFISRTDKQKQAS